MSVLPRGPVLLAFVFEKGLQLSLLGVLGIAGIIGAGVLLLLMARWLRRKARDQTPAAGDVLTHFRELHQRGELSREEFQRIRSTLAQQIRRDLTDRK